ncbi:MAG TPA: hypothetical protein VK177_07330 [Flavobacteriales bacterium]|nr:hypothetical protein [Flavobacteriales bacterium]
MAHERDRKKSPEEMAQIMNELKNQKDIQKSKDDIKKVKNGQIIIFLLAGLMVLSSLVEYYQLGEEPFVFYIYAPIVAIFLLLGFLYFKDPVAVPTIALVLYCILIVIAGAGDPVNIVKGIVIKALIIVGLVRAIKYGKDYKVARVALESDPLDQGLFEQK